MSSLARPDADAALTVRSIGYESATAQELIAALLRDLNARYGQEDVPPADAADYAPPRGDFLVAMAGATAVGCAGFVQVEEGLAELTSMFVRAEWRRRGVGSVLLRDIEERAWASGYGALRLETGRRQPEALALYRRSGYREIPRFPPHCEDELSVCMAKELRPFAALAQT